MGTVSFGTETLRDEETNEVFYSPNIQIKASDGSKIEYVMNGYVRTLEEAREICVASELALRAERHNMKFNPDGDLDEDGNLTQ